MPKGQNTKRINLVFKRTKDAKQRRSWDLPSELKEINSLNLGILVIVFLAEVASINTCTQIMLRDVFNTTAKSSTITHRNIGQSLQALAKYTGHF